jgi:hypothetical protein
MKTFAQQDYSTQFAPGTLPPGKVLAASAA